MNWEAIGAIGQIVGAIAVIATIGYLARQIKQQNASTAVSMHASILDGFNDSVAPLAGSKELTKLFNIGMWNPELLSDDEASQFSHMFRLFINQWLKLYQLHQEGILSESDWRAYAAQGAYLANSPGGVLFCEGQRDTWGDFFDALSSATVDGSALDFTLGRGAKSKLTPNHCVKLTVQSVIRFACAKRPPLCPAAYACC